MSKIFITSDPHFCHNQEFVWRPRGFNSVYEMNNEIIKRWNSIVQTDDEVFCLGDMMLNDDEEGLRCIKQLNGYIHLIRGNHDTNNRMLKYGRCWNICEISEGQFLDYKNYHFYLSHYPCLTSNYDDEKPLKAKIISLCGHTHTQNPFIDWDKGCIFHCELDSNNCYPWLIDDIITHIKGAIK